MDRLRAQVTTWRDCVRAAELLRARCEHPPRAQSVVLIEETGIDGEPNALLTAVEVWCECGARDVRRPTPNEVMEAFS